MSHDPFIVATAIEIVLRAGRMQLARVGDTLRIDKKSPIDLVTDADVAVERMFRGIIEERFPEHAVLAEELGEREGAGASASYRWVFDPIDGTTNYAHGLPFFCSSLALEVDGRAEVGAVYEPIRRELFVAERGEGAFLNGAPLRVSRATELLDSLLCTGFPYDVHENREALVGLFGYFLGRTRAVRRLGSAALDLCYVAAGRLDGFWEQRLNPWDISAGSLIVEEAGGRVTGLAGEPFTSASGRIVAANERIHGAMVQAILQFGRERSRNETN